MASSYLKTYFKVLITILLVIGLVNFMVDPLWYWQGNQLTGRNLPWNERITKTNLLLKNKKDYDCLLLGTSRATLFKTSFLKQNECFNYSLSGGKLEEIVNYGQYAQRKGAKPTKLYIEIDPNSFNRRSQPKAFPEVTDPLPAYQAYFFSLNTFWLSVRSLTGLHSYRRMYDRKFQGRLADDVPEYEPEFAVENEDHQGCDFERIQLYQQLKQLYPQATFVGFVPPLSAWYVYNNQYANGLLNCQLAGIHQLTNLFEAVYDFSIPSVLTTQTANTYDGNHYYPKVYQHVADVLEGRRSDFGIKVNDYALENYWQLYITQIKAFLEQAGKPELWKG